MRVPGLKHMRHSARWVRSRFIGGAFIIGYHRIADDANDVYSQSVRPQYFDEQLRILQQQTNPITLDELTQHLRCDTLPHRSVVVTFDDGYADNLYQASPILAQYDIPAIFFITTGFLGEQFWWDELAHLILNHQSLPGELLLVADGQTVTWPISGQNKSKILGFIYRRLLNMTAEAREQAMGQLRQQIGDNAGQATIGGRALTPQELSELTTGELVTIGAHTVSHPVLTSLPEESQRYEIEQNKQDLETILGKPVTAFSYPNGAGNETTKALLQQNGFVCACSSFNDVARVGSNPLNLPRFWAQDQRGSDFARWLNYWLK